MLIFRLTRVGKKNRPYFRIVVAEHTAPIKGKFISIVGHYDPIRKNVVLKKDEINVWLLRGVKPSNTVAKLFIKQGLKHKLIKVIQFKKKAKKSKEEKAPEEKITPAESSKTLKTPKTSVDIAKNDKNIDTPAKPEMDKKEEKPNK